MADEERRPSMSSPGDLKRRGSFGRALDKCKNVLKRTYSRRVVPTVPIEEATVELRPTPSPPAPETAPADIERPTAAAQDVLPLPTSLPVMDGALKADEGLDNASEQEEDTFSAPNLESSRTGLSDERARRLFDKYGVDYGNRRLPTHEPASKVRRVERPLRIRVHWTCHECRKTFAGSKTCAECGHRKCDECIREPPKRAKDRMDAMRQNITEEDILAGPAGTMPAELTTVRPAIAPTGEDDLAEETANPSLFLFTIRARTSGGVQYVHRPTAQILRRKCHECNTPFGPSTKTDCQNCGHVRCERCPRHSPKVLTRGDTPMIEEPVQAPPGLERVYKKPRMRIRWTCDKCNSPAGRDKCTKCDHERCSGCLREPPLKEERRFDPAAVKSVQDKLDAMPPSREEWPRPVSTQS